MNIWCAHQRVFAIIDLKRPRALTPIVIPIPKMVSIPDNLFPIVYQDLEHISHRGPTVFGTGGSLQVIFCTHVLVSRIGTNDP